MLLTIILLSMCAFRSCGNQDRSDPSAEISGPASGLNADSTLFIALLSFEFNYNIDPGIVPELT
jgi:hypothetical protein